MKSTVLASLFSVLLVPAVAFADPGARRPSHVAVEADGQGRTAPAKATDPRDATKLGAAPFFGFTGTSGPACASRVEGRGAGAELGAAPFFGFTGTPGPV